MINEPVRYIDEFVKSGADIITVHVEACSDVAATLEKIREAGVKVGITLNPGTPVSAIEPYLPMVDMVLVMSVNPGFGGQKFIESSIEKLREVKDLRDARGLNFDIEVDGGINIDNLLSVLEAGANVIVAGSAIFSGDAAENVKNFRGVMNA
jgi:ribulose-phosphate 3-epimerase